MATGILLRDELRSLKSAAEQETDFILALRNQTSTEILRHELWQRRDSIASLVRHHLRLAKSDTCAVLPPETWMQGSFNICILVQVESAGRTRSLVFRCPMPHKHAEHHYPGTVDEKVGCEVAAYVWMQEYCADIRIPALYAFGFVDGSHFAHVDQRPFHVALYRAFQRWIHRLLRYPLLSNYTRDSCAPAVDTAYVLLEYIGVETGRMLSVDWAQHMNDACRRARLYRGMSRIMLSLARLPQPRIGSFRFNTNDGTITLTNRPWTCTMMIFENGGTPRTIHPGQIYQSTDSFTSDMLTLHDNHLLHYPHAVRNEDDARERMTIRTLLRTVMHHFISSDRRNGPFILQLTDFHQSNILVDEDWNVTCLIDLEWISALPAEMLSVPYWLTNCSIDDIIDDQYGPFDEARQAFLRIMDEEKTKMQLGHDIPITSVMRDAWASKGVWFWACIRSINGWLFLFEDHILPRFSADKGLVADTKQMSNFWHEDIEATVKAKLDDEERYQVELRSLFESQGVSEASKDEKNDDPQPDGYNDSQ